MGALDREACFGKGNEPLQDLFLAKETLMSPLHNSDIRHVKACGDAWEMCEGDNTDPHASCTLSPHCFVMREATARTRPVKLKGRLMTEGSLSAWEQKVSSQAVSKCISSTCWLFIN